MNAPSLAERREDSLSRSWLSADATTDLETCCYVFDPTIVVARHAALKAAIGTPLVVSVKANPNIDLYVRTAQSFTDGVELASIGELNLVVGRAAVPRFVTSPAMNRDFMAAAIASRATVLIDNADQVALALALAPASKGQARFGLRLNAASLTSDAPVDHFGLDLDGALAAARRLAAIGAPPVGLHVYGGSYSFGKASIALAQAASKAFDAIDTIVPDHLEFLNLGGGFSEDWVEDDAFTAYRDVVRTLGDRTTILHEAGRAIYADCGAFVTKVVAVKVIGDEAYVVCDGGLAQAFLLAQTERFIKSLATPRVIRHTPAVAHGGLRSVHVVGNSCNRVDRIGVLPPSDLPAIGDLLIFDRCGAYHTYSPNGFLNLPAAGRYIIS